MAGDRVGATDNGSPSWLRLNFRFGPRLPVILQTEAAECALACLAMVSAYYGYQTDLPTLRRRFSLSLKGATLADLTRMANAIGFANRAVRIELEDLTRCKAPCVLHWNFVHFVVLKRVSSRGVEIHDPAFGVRTLPFSEVSKHFTGIALELTPTPAFETKEDRQSIKLAVLLGKVVGLRRSLVQILVLALALQIIGLTSPFFLQAVVDGVLLSNDKDLLVTLTVGFSLLLLIQIGLTWMRSRMVLYLSTHLGLQWNANVFTHLLRLPVSYFEKRHIGDVVSRLGSMQRIQQTLTTSFVEAILDGAMGVATLMVMLFYSPVLTEVVATAVFLYAMVRWLAYRPLHTSNQEEIALSAKQQSHLLETIRGVQSVKLFCREDQRRSHYLNLAVETTNRHIRSESLTMLYSAGNSLIFGACTIAITYFGAGLVIDSAFSVGMLFAFISYSVTFSTRASSLIDKWAELKMLSLQTERLGDILLSAPEEQSRLNESTPLKNLNAERLVLPELLLEMRDVSYRYADGEPFVLNHCSIRIAPGEFVAIVGPSGCGKTTLAKVLLGLLPPTEGEVLVGGRPISHIGLLSFRSLFGSVMQEDQLFAGSISDNIHFFDTHGDQRFVEFCAQLAAIHDEILAMPMAYNTLIGDMGTAISGGQKQRVLLARALYKRPQILVLDEATSHLDVANEKAVNDALSRLKIARIVIAHRPETIAAAQRIVHLSNGSVLQAS